MDIVQSTPLDFAMPTPEEMKTDTRWAELLDQGFVFSQQIPTAEAAQYIQNTRRQGHETETAPAYTRYNPFRGELMPDQLALFIRPRTDIDVYRATIDWYRKVTKAQGARAIAFAPTNLESRP